MHLIAPDVLAEACAPPGLSVGVSAAGAGVGLLLWLFGWWGHRFWIVLLATLAAGVVGLASGPAHGLQPLAAGLLLAVAAGAMALAVARVVAFSAGGAAAWLAVHSLAPAWDEPLVCFLAGGLVGLLLYRVWLMALTSFAGTLLMAFFGLCLAHALGKLNAAEWAEARVVLLNWLCGGGAVLGLVVQFLMDQRRLRLQREYEEEERSRRLLRGRPWWWNWGSGYYYRRVG